RCEAAKHAARLDPASVVRRRARAAADRRVTVTPAPDAMSRVTITVPVEQGVAAYAALKNSADAVRGTVQGAGRSRGQLMADAAICRLTGQEHADRVPVRINLIMNHHALFGTGTGADAGFGEETVKIVERGIGSFELPAELARRLAHQAARAAASPTSGSTSSGVGAGGGTGVGTVGWIRRLYAHPTSGQLVAMDSGSRQVPVGLGDFITLRDQTCRTRYCDAPARHFDHIEPVEDGGGTTVENLQGLCEACNHAKQAPGWHQHAVTEDDGTHRVDTSTPAGQRYTSRPPTT
ncbi:HNH endonuclease, partial [Nocardioides alcanivorans]|uniref:HNH endonuclease n=1 Tax=Nocardioides alcanivorans TaxID=2897352 RepID=UPI001F305E56